MIINMQKDIIVQKLRDQGCRITKQRLMLLDIILEGNCSNCKEIFYKASKRDKNIGTATVYRMINALEDVGAINRRNIYRISFGEECGVEKACQVELDDGSKIELTASAWNEVIREGLKKCGHIDKQNESNRKIDGCEGRGSITPHPLRVQLPAEKMRCLCHGHRRKTAPCL